MTVSDGVSPSPKVGGGAEPARPPLNPPLVNAHVTRSVSSSSLLGLKVL